MQIDYQAVGNMLETTGKEMQRVNNKLDKVLEKLLDLEGMEARKAEAIDQISRDDIGTAINTLKAIEKDLGKAETWHAEETALREELKALMAKAELAAQGATAAEPEEANVSDIRPKVKAA